MTQNLRAKNIKVALKSAIISKKDSETPPIAHEQESTEETRGRSVECRR